MDSKALHRPALRLLAIGFLPPPVGGMSVSFKIFCDIISIDSKVELKVMNLSGMRKSRSLLKDTFVFVKRLWAHAKKSDVVMLYCATPQVPTLGLVVLALCRVRGKRFVLRKAAGLDHRDLGTFSGRVAEYVVKRADLFLVQTRHLAGLCRNRGVNRTKWYPTSRPAGHLIEKRVRCRRFVFVGHVRPSKGIAELIAVADCLPNNATIDVYGPFYDGIDEGLFQGHSGIYYRGILDPAEVVTTIGEYDAFVLPSKAPTEGYPGAILEALSIGLPVISTTVGGIPEIVDAQCGILVEPGCVDALASAMHSVVTDELLYQSLCYGASKVRDHLSAEYWTDWLVQQCIRLSLESSKA
jgi:glycosyltransferase involved in cell wall biosynthesis